MCGIFASPGYPCSIDAHETYTWIVSSAKQDNLLQFTFHIQFQASDTSCSSGKVSLDDSVVLCSRTNKTGLSTLSNWPKAVVKFVTGNKGLQGKGFYATYVEKVPTLYSDSIDNTSKK